MLTIDYDSTSASTLICIKGLGADGRSLVPVRIYTNKMRDRSSKLIQINNTVQHTDQPKLEALGQWARLGSFLKMWLVFTIFSNIESRFPASFGSRSSPG